MRVHCLAVLALVVMLGLSGQTISQTNKQPSIPANVPTSFDIPAQPLVRALDAYSAATGLMVLYDSNLAEGHRSTAVSGVLMPDVAIRTLLEGTGLVVFSAGRAFAIEAGPSDQQDGVVTSNAAEMSYLALVQQAVERSFCEKPETKPGEYRAAVQFRIGISGEILSPELLSSTGDQGRDSMIVELLTRLRIRRAPPAGMAQPVSMIISPRPPTQSGDCGFAGNPSLPQPKP